MKMNGKTLRQTRLELGLSQAKLAELSGISQYVLSSLELGKVDLTDDVRDIITSALADKAKVAIRMVRQKTKKKDGAGTASIEKETESACKKVDSMVQLKLQSL